MDHFTGLKCERKLSELAEGNKAALGDIYTIAGRNMFALAFSIVQDYQLAEDVVQDSLISILNNAAKVEKREKAYSWIMTIVRNTALTKLRNRKAEISTDDITAELDARSSSCIPEDDIAVHQALAKLDSDDRQIVLMKSVMGFKHSEIAKILNISEAACQKRYQRSIKELKEYLS